MNSLPTELNLKILRHVRNSIPNEAFAADADAYMAHGTACNNLLLGMAKFHRHWTAAAQSELFHHMILVDEDKIRSLLKLLRKRRNNRFRKYAQMAASCTLGYCSGSAQNWDDLKDDLDELAEYCPNIVEVSCDVINTKFSDFGELYSSPAEIGLISWCPAEKIKRLKRLNLLGRRYDGSGAFSLSITHLAMKGCYLPNPLDPSSFPFLRHLFYDCASDDSLRSVLPLLPQIQCLRIGESCSLPQTHGLVSASISLTTISISDFRFEQLIDESQNIIKERLEVVVVKSGRYRVDFSKLAEYITGSTVLKKVILDGLMSTFPIARANRMAELKKLIEACEEQGTVELWKENFTVNGKVDLNADLVCSLMSSDPWTATYSSYRSVRQPHLNWYESVRP
jgi:hypothetical protein